MYKKVSVWLFVIGITERHLRPNCVCPNRAGPADQLQPDVCRLPVPAGQAVRRQVRHGRQGHPGEEHLDENTVYFFYFTWLYVSAGLYTVRRLAYNARSCFELVLLFAKHVKDALNLKSPTYTISRSRFDFIVRAPQRHLQVLASVARQGRPGLRAPDRAPDGPHRLPGQEDEGAGREVLPAQRRARVHQRHLLVRGELISAERLKHWGAASTTRRASAASYMHLQQ